MVSHAPVCRREPGPREVPRRAWGEGQGGSGLLTDSRRLRATGTYSTDGGFILVPDRRVRDAGPKEDDWLSKHRWAEDKLDQFSISRAISQALATHRISLLTLLFGTRTLLFIYCHNRFHCMEFGLLSPWKASRQSTALPILFLFLSASVFNL